MSRFRYDPDTCYCVLIVDENFQLKKWNKKCEIHKNEIDSNLVNAVLAHNNSFNDELLTEEQRRANKKNERDRIKALGSGVKS